MSTEQRPLGEMLGAVPEAIAQHHALPPDAKAIARVNYGAFLLGTCGYVAATYKLSAFPKEWILGLAGCAGFGLLLLGAGLRGTRGRPRDMMTVFWVIVLPIAGLWAMAKWWPEAQHDFLMRGFIVAVLTVFAVRFFIAVRGPGGGNAQNIVTQQIRQTQINWRGVKPR
jgi:hypothetical protein